MTIDLFTDSPVGIGQFVYAGTGAGDPGAGNFALPNATTLLLDNLSKSGLDVGAMLDAAGGGHIKLCSQGKDRSYSLTTVVDSTGYRTLTVALPQDGLGFSLVIGQWYAVALVGGGAPIASVGDHTDFDMTGVGLNKIPKWNGTKFTMQADLTGTPAASARTKASAIVQADIPAGTVAVGPGGDSAQNLSANLIGYTGLTFEQVIELDVNGRGKVPSAGATADVYPALTALDIAAGGFRAVVALRAGDVVQAFSGGGLGSTAPWIEDTFVPTAGQVTFILSAAPTAPVALSLHANGVEAVEVADYTVGGQTIAWLNTAYSFETSDRVVIQYK